MVNEPKHEQQARAMTALPQASPSATARPQSDELDALRPYLFSIAYRMLGNAGEAEDMVQEAFLRYIVARPRDLQSPKAYLATVVTRLCLDHLKSARVKRAAYHGPWLPSPVLTADLAPGPEEQAEYRDDVSLAFLMLLERLTPHERAAFVLREAFGYSYDEIAAVLRNTSAASRKLVQRARERVGEPRRRKPVSVEELHRLTERFFHAARQGDLGRLEELLAADVTHWVDGGDGVRAARRPIEGRDRVARQLAGLLVKIFPDVVASFEPINGGVGILWWQGDHLISVAEIELDGDAISAIYTVLNPDKLARVRARVQPPLVTA